MNARMRLLVLSFALAGCYQSHPFDPEGGVEGASSCASVLRVRSAAPSGTYLLRPRGGAEVSVFCDMEADGGGWTLVAASRGQALDDARGPYHDDLALAEPLAAHSAVWDGMRSELGARSGIRFTCGQAGRTEVDLSFDDVDWYQEITLGTDAQSCFSESNGDGYDRPAPARRDNLRGVSVPAGDDWDAGFLEGEDSCGDDGDFTVDLDDRGMDSNEADGTDWGEDDGTPKCGRGDGLVFQIWVR